MSLFDRFHKAPAPQQQFVIVSLTNLDINDTHEHYEESEMMKLEDQLDGALANADAGGFWENAFEKEAALIHFIGTDAERMFTVMEPVLRASPLCRHAIVTLRQGDAGAPQREIHIA